MSVMSLKNALVWREIGKVALNFLETLDAKRDAKPRIIKEKNELMHPRIGLLHRLIW